MCCLALLAMRGVGAADIPVTATACQAPGWDMSRELKAFGLPPHALAAGTGASSAPLLRVDTLYAVRLRPQGEVQFPETPGRAAKAATPMAGIAQLKVRTSGVYRITLDSPLWIDVVTAEGTLAPKDYTGWHECSAFRKSVDFSLKAGHALTLQFSDAATDLVKVAIEPATAP
jgi:hypothetical protein